MQVIQRILDINDDEVKPERVTQLGYVASSFSSIFGRHIFKGVITFEAHRNYRSSEAFNLFKDENRTSIPCTMMLIDDMENYSAMTKFPSLESFADICPNDTSYLLIGIVGLRGKKLDGKKQKRYFKIDKQKRFFIPIKYAVMMRGSEVTYHSEFKISTTISL